MTYINTNLNNLFGLGVGVTQKYSLTYDNTLSAADGVNNGNALLPFLDTDFAQMLTWFEGIGLPFQFPIAVQIGTGAFAGAGWPFQPPITLRPGPNQSVNLLRYLIVSEVTEMFMDKKKNGWGFSFNISTEGASGEGLSRFLGFQFMLANSLDTSILTQGTSTFFVANLWLQSSARADYVNYDPDDNTPDAVTGCTTLFINYLFTQLGFKIPAIIDAGSPTMAGVYNKLTSDPGDPFPFFKRLIGTSFPGTNGITSGPNFDNPFPLGILSFVVDNSTFGRDQVQDIISTQGGIVFNAFWLVLEGFSIDTFESAGITLPMPTGSFLGLDGVSIVPSAATRGGPTPFNPIALFEDPSNPKAPQRIRFSFDVEFKNLNVFPGVGGPPVFGELDAVALIDGGPLSGCTTTTIFELLGGENPYFTNIDPFGRNQEPYLSQDLRVFPVAQGKSVLGGPVLTSDPYQYIQSLIVYLNDGTKYTNPANYAAPNDPLDLLSGQQGFETGDSSVYAFNVNNKQNYNFAIARVRLRAPALAKAENVRVFFRLWVAQSCDTDFNSSTTYPSKLGTSGADNNRPLFPLPSGTFLTDPSGQFVRTIPFFATGINGDYDYSNFYPHSNIRSIEIPAGTDQVWAYYGCFLDVFNPDNSEKFGGTHHCIVAEIAYDDAPITTVTGTGAVTTPFNSDKLAQRNIQITVTEDPTSPATHIAPAAFDIRPSRALSTDTSSFLALPDELMIDWGNTPVGSTVNIYWPQVNAADVLSLANSLYSSHLLSVLDANTLQCTVTKGVTYIPIVHVPENVNFAGLITVDLPDTILDGDYFRVLIRRITTRPVLSKRFQRGTIATVPHSLKQNDAVTPRSELSNQTQSDETNSLVRLNSTAPVEANMNSRTSEFTFIRQVVGAFQISMPVTNRAVMLWPEENTLAVLKWRLQNMKPINRWYPVLLRYVDLVTARVAGLGGDPTSIPPTLGGVPFHGHGGGCHHGGGIGGHKGHCGHGGHDRCGCHDAHDHGGRGSHGAHGGHGIHGRNKGIGTHGACGEHGRHGGHGKRCVTVDICGKVTSVIYGGCGNFEGFHFQSEDGHEHKLRGSTSELEELVTKAWASRWVVTITTEEGDVGNLVAIVLNHAS